MTDSLGKSSKGLILKRVASQEEKLLSWFCVILHLQHCLEEKTQNFMRARQSSTRQVDVLCEAEHAYRDTTLSR